MFDLLINDTGFMFLASAIVPFMVRLVTGIFGDLTERSWVDQNKPVMAVACGAALGLLYFISCAKGWLPECPPESTILVYAISGGYAGLAASGIASIAKDVRDKSISGRKV